MNFDLSEDQVRDILREAQPDLVGCTAITPSIYKAQRVLEITREVCPQAVTVLGGIHATFMYQQVLGEAPWIDAIVRGEGEEIIVNLVRAVDEGRWPAGRDQVQGIAYQKDGQIIATPAAPTNPQPTMPNSRPRPTETAMRAIPARKASPRTVAGLRVNQFNSVATRECRSLRASLNSPA